MTGGGSAGVEGQIERHIAWLRAQLAGYVPEDAIATHFKVLGVEAGAEAFRDLLSTVWAGPLADSIRRHATVLSTKSSKLVIASRSPDGSGVVIKLDDELPSMSGLPRPVESDVLQHWMRMGVSVPVIHQAFAHDVLLDRIARPMRVQVMVMEQLGPALHSYRASEPVTPDEAVEYAAALSRELHRCHSERPPWIPELPIWDENRSNTERRWTALQREFPDLNLLGMLPPLITALTMAPQSAVLLHGDAALDNALRCGRGIALIDPVGTTGSGMFDIARLIARVATRAGGGRAVRAALRAVVVREYGEVDDGLLSGWLLVETLTQLGSYPSPTNSEERRAVILEVFAEAARAFPGVLGHLPRHQRGAGHGQQTMAPGVIT